MMSCNYKLVRHALITFVVMGMALGMWGQAWGNPGRASRGEIYEWGYGILEESPHELSTEFFIDTERTTLNIDHDKQEIRLDRKEIKFDIGFMNEEYHGTAYSVMGAGGVGTFMFDGEKMREVDYLRINSDGPLGMATNRYSTDIVLIDRVGIKEGVIEEGEDDTGESSEDSGEKIGKYEEANIIYYNMDSAGLVKNPFLEIAGLQNIISITSIEEEHSMELAVLGKDSVDIYGNTGGQMENIPDLKIKEIKNPLDIASNGRYNIAVLEQSGVRQFAFDGQGMREIPGLSIPFVGGEGNGAGSSGSPRAFSITDDTVTVLTDKTAQTFEFSGEGYSHVGAYSVTSGLQAPRAIAVNKLSRDIIIVDGADGKGDTAGDIKVKYMAFDGKQMVEIPQLGTDLPDFLVGKGLFDDSGVVLSKPLEIRDGLMGLIQVGAYSRLEEGTQMMVSVKVGGRGEVETDSDWTEIIKASREKGKGREEVDIRVNSDGMGNWKGLKGLADIYPSKMNLDMGLGSTLGEASEGDLVDGGYRVTEEGGDIKLVLYGETGGNVDYGDWIPLLNAGGEAKLGNYLALKIEFSSEDGSGTPVIFVPQEEGENYIEGIDDVRAIRVVGRRNTLVPIIKDVYNKWGDDKEVIKKAGWVYTTEPTISWGMPEEVGEQYVDAYQIIVLGKGGESEGWAPVYTTPKTSSGGSSGEITIPTGDRVDQEGPLYKSGCYHFATFVRIWDERGVPSEFSLGKEFKVLAFERPRIIDVVDIYNEGFNPMMIKRGMRKEELPWAKAGASVTFMVDSVGPIEETIDSGNGISTFYFEIEDEHGEILNRTIMEEANRKMKNGAVGWTNRWSIDTWTPASKDETPDGTIVKVKLVGNSKIGGRTVLNIPEYADGIIKIENTAYKDWQVFLGGRDRE